MTTLNMSMELCSLLNPADSQLQRSNETRNVAMKIRNTAFASAKKVSLVQHWRRESTNNLSALVTGDSRMPTSYLKHSELHLPNGDENTTLLLHCESDGRRNAALKRDDSARMTIPGQFQWYYSIKDFTKPMPRSRTKKWEVQGVGVGEDMPAKYQNDDPIKQLSQRRCGILLHPTSLPGPHGIGDLGKDAYNFIDWLKETGCTVWQVLPLVPPGRRGGEDGSPYAGVDANCGNTLLISLECLVNDGLLEKSELPNPVPVKRMNSTKVAAAKDPLVTKAAARLVGLGSGKLRDDFEAFRKDPKISSWVEEAALFAAIDQSTKATTWWTWPSHLRDRDPNAMKVVRNEHKGFIDVFVAAQFLFQRQWQALHKYANEAGIRILGDMPMYVGGHSADVWAHRLCFELDPKTGVPLAVSGVPPDTFSATGQLWGSPLYNWKEMAKDKYSWWTMRILRAYELFDEFRIDHFRGFAGYWAIPANAQSAMSGKWKAGPGKAFFTAMKEAVGKNIDIVAEDLGIITTDVVALRKELHAPGMAVLQFAFGDNARNPHLPHNHELEQVVYPGTHDNDTCVGWWKKATEEDKDRAKKYLRFHHDTDVHWEFIRSAAASVAKTAIIPMQDVMGLDNNSRMNIPATQAGNWGWRIGESEVFLKLDKEKCRLRKFLCRYNRLTPEFREKCKTIMAKIERSSETTTTTTTAPSSAAASMARSIGKSLESLTGMKMPVVGEASEKAKDKVDKEAPSTFEKLKEKFKEKASKLTEKATEKLPKQDDNKSKDSKPKQNDNKSKDKPKDDKPKQNGKSKDKPTDGKPKQNDKSKDKPKDDKPKQNEKDQGKDNTKKK